MYLPKDKVNITFEELEHIIIHCQGDSFSAVMATIKAQSDINNLWEQGDHK